MGAMKRATMRLYVIFAQRVERYEGEYTPEAMECMDEIGWDENSEWLLDKLDKVKAQSDILSAKIFEIELAKGAGDFIRKSLIDSVPNMKAVNVAIIEEN